MNTESSTPAIRDFIRRHGTPVRYQGMDYFPDAAKREPDPWGPQFEPPPDISLRLLNIVCYHKGRLEHAVNDFDNLKEKLLHGSPDEKGLAELKKLQQVANECSAAVKKAEQDYAATPQGQQQAANRSAPLEAATARRDWQDQLKAINI
jgi:hypothetical protein